MIQYFTDITSRRLYSTDASIYRQLPQAVTYPETKGDCVSIINDIKADSGSLTFRAGGTSIGGQAIGSGTIVDTSRYMTSILGCSDDQHVRVEPGVVLQDLNQYLSRSNKVFAPETSTQDRCTIGGMIGNNAAGKYSVMYGTTREHVYSLDVILTDGSQTIFEPLTECQLQKKMELSSFEGRIYREVFSLIDRNRQLIKEKYPSKEIVRRNTGYALDILADMQPWNPHGQSFNLAPLICGSEGTLVFVNQAELSVVDKFQCKAVVCIYFESVEEAVDSVSLLLNKLPSAIELLDKRILDLAIKNTRQAVNRSWIQGDPGSMLIVEYLGDTIEYVNDWADQITQFTREQEIGYASSILEGADVPAVGELRSAGLGLLMGSEGRKKPVAIIEDSAVPVDSLSAYVRNVKKIMNSYGVDCVYYGHASVGLLHLRPELDLSNKSDRLKFESLSKEVFSLVKQYGGSLSGEHGDGRVRAPYLKKYFGTEVYNLNKRIKEIFDPNNIFNPGVIVNGGRLSERIDLRAEDKIKLDGVTGFRWSRDEGISSVLTKCNGAGVCRRRNGKGVMCPTFRATGMEHLSTRGRSSLLQYVFDSRNILVNELEEEDVRLSISSCLSCKACKSECPSNVDMARLKSEYLYLRIQNVGMSFRDYLVRYYSMYLRVADVLPVMFNWIQNFVITRRILGVSSKVLLPKVSSVSFGRWWRRNYNRGELESGKNIILLVDIYSDYYEPEVPISAVKVLQELGFSVLPLRMKSSPRQLISQGLLGDAAREVDKLVHSIMMLDKDGSIPVVGLEPAEISVFIDEMPDLVSSVYEEDGNSVRSRMVLFDEFMNDHLTQSDQMCKRLLGKLSRDDVKVKVHTHCHQKSVLSASATVEMLNKLPGVNATEMDVGCCGMAGQFGYENPELSKKIASMRFFPEIQNLGKDEMLVSTGLSCRSQARRLNSIVPLHSAVFLENRLVVGSVDSTSVSSGMCNIAA